MPEKIFQAVKLEEVIEDICLGTPGVERPQITTLEHNKIFPEKLFLFSKYSNLVLQVLLLLCQIAGEAWLFHFKTRS